MHQWVCNPNAVEGGARAIAGWRDEQKETLKAIEGGGLAQEIYGN